MQAPIVRRFGAGLAAAGLASTLAAAQPAAPEGALDFYAAAPDLRAYVVAAVERNPTVLESHARYRMARQRVPQVTALPDPVVSFTQALRSVETRVGPQLNSVTLTQTFPWFGTLKLRGQVALLEATALHHDYEAVRQDVVTRVKHTYYDLGYVDAALGLAREEQSLLAHYETLASARYATGAGLQQAVIRLQAEITRVVDRRHQLERRRATLAAHLNTLRDRPPEEPVSAVPPLTRPAVELDRTHLRRLGESHRHELRAASALIEGSAKSIELARRDSRPDFTASVGVTNVGGRDAPPGLPLPPDNGRNAVTVSLGVSLPLWGAKYRAGVEQAGDEMSAHARSRAAAHNAMELEVEEAIVRLETLNRQIDLLDTVLIPQTEEALRATETAYETGGLGVLELLDSERTLIDIRSMRARYLSDLLIALAALERAIGTRVPLAGRTP
jgi:outer membrane protein TolC